MRHTLMEQMVNRDYLNPDWEGVTRYVGDWRNHIPDGIRIIWDTFTDDQKKALYDWAEESADRSCWTPED